MPRNDPPTKYADYVRNDTACFEELINPIPSKNVDLQSGLTKLCNPVSSIKISVVVFADPAAQSFMVVTLV